MNLVKEFLLLKAKVDKLYCQLIAKGSDEQDPTVPNHVKTIKQEDIDNWNNIKEEEVQITEDTAFAQIGQSQKDFNKSVSDYKTNSDLKNQEQDNRLSDIEGKNIAQDDLINDLSSEIAYEKVRNDAQDSRLENLEGINYTWSPTNRVLTLFDNNGTQLSQVSLVSLDNEGTDIRYNASTLSLELYNADNELLASIPVSSFIGSVGTQLQLSSNELQLKDSQGNILSTVTFEVNNISGLQTALNNKLNIPTMTNNYYGLWDDTNKKFINGQLNQDTNGNIGIGATPTDSKVELSPLANQTALKVLNYSLTGSNIKPALDINGTWNTSGNPTLIKATVTNTTSNANTLLMDLQVNGASQFKVSKNGIVTFTGPLYINSISNTRLHLMSFGGNGDESVLSNPVDNAGTSGQKVFIDAAIGIKPTSGNSTLISFLSRPTINQTGGANGITRGLYINPTLTSATDWRSIEWSNNTGYGLYGTGTANNFLAGNLGIGKLLPVEKLDINGNVKAIDFKGQSVKFNLQTSISPTPNTLVPKTDGSGLLWYNNSSVENNIPFLPYNWVFGLGSGLIDTNTAIGSDALSSNINGMENTAIGYRALSSNTSGTDNTAIGYSALLSNENGRENTAIGYNALSSNINGMENTAIGSGALLSNTTGRYNTAIGYYAGYDSDSVNMIAIGYNVAGKGSYTVELGNDDILNTYLKGKVNLNNRLKLASYNKAQRDALPNKEVGDMIWQTDSGNSGIRVFDGTNWLALQTTID